MSYPYNCYNWKISDPKCLLHKKRVKLSCTKSIYSGKNGNFTLKFTAQQKYLQKGQQQTIEVCIDSITHIDSIQLYDSAVIVLPCLLHLVSIGCCMTCVLTCVSRLNMSQLHHHIGSLFLIPASFYEVLCTVFVSLDIFICVAC